MYHRIIKSTRWFFIPQVTQVVLYPLLFGLKNLSFIPPDFNPLIKRNKELRKKGSPCIFMYKHCNFLSAFGWNEKKHMGTYTLRDATSHATYYLIGNLPKRKLFCWIRLCIVIRRNRKFSFRTRPWW